MSFCIIFDLDGTLIDSRHDLTTAVNLVRQSYGLESLPLEKVVGFVGDGAGKLMERALRGHAFSLDQAVARMREYYLLHLLDRTVPYEGVTDGLARLRDAGIKLAVVTNKPYEATRHILDKMCILRYFDVIIGGSSGFPLKPEPEALLYVLETFSSVASDSWMVGDNYTDLESGRRAGMKRCYAAYGFGDPGVETFEFKTETFSIFVDFILSLVRMTKNGNPMT